MGAACSSSRVLETTHAPTFATEELKSAQEVLDPCTHPIPRAPQTSAGLAKPDDQHTTGEEATRQSEPTLAALAKILGEGGSGDAWGAGVGMDEGHGEQEGSTVECHTEEGGITEEFRAENPAVWVKNGKQVLGLAARRGAMQGFVGADTRVSTFCVSTFLENRSSRKRSGEA